MKRSATTRIWDGLWLAVVLIPLAIVWVGRTPMIGMPALVMGSAAYVAAVILTVGWMRSRWGRGLTIGLLACAASVGAAMAFEGIGRTALEGFGPQTIGLEVAVALILYLSASNAAWLLVWTVARAISGARKR